MSEENEELAQDPQPKRSKAKKTTKKRVANTPGRKRNLTSTIEASLLLPAGMWAAVDPECGGAFMDQVPELASALNTLAAKDPRVYRFFNGLGEVGGWAGVALALAPVGMVVANHHLIPLTQRAEPGPEMIEQEPQEELGTTYVNPNQVAG
jgi:hypothetical protein